MCRVYRNHYTWCGHFSRIQTFPCSETLISPEDCPTIHSTPRLQSSFCPYCWSLVCDIPVFLSRHERLDHTRFDPIEPLPYITQGSVQRIRARVLGNEHLLSMTELDNFRGLADPADIIWLKETLKLLHQDLIYRLYTANVPRPTEEEIIVMLQIRTAVDRAHFTTLEEQQRGSDASRFRALFKSVSTSSLEEGDLDCAICAERFGPDEMPCRTRCGHLFGQKCIRRWIQQGDKNGCPHCRRPFETLMVLNARGWGEQDPLRWLRILRGQSP